MPLDIGPPAAGEVLEATPCYVKGIAYCDDDILVVRLLGSVPVAISGSGFRASSSATFPGSR